VEQQTLIPESLFSSVIYTIKKPEFLAETSIAVDESLAAAKAARPINEIYPVHMTDSLSGNPNAAKLERFIAESGWAILNSQGYMMDQLETFVSEFWAQEHHKHSGMEQHVHPYGVVLSGFYFIQTPDNGCMVEIHDPRPGKVQASLPIRDAEKVTEASNSLFIPPAPGMLVFTNAWLPHSFTRNASDTPVKFIHFNVSVRPAQQPSGPIVV
jgi:uncharacterized protein (TIGR02466 family)